MHPLAPLTAVNARALTTQVLRVRVKLREGIIAYTRKGSTANHRVEALVAVAAAAITDLAQQLADGDIDEHEFVAGVREALVSGGADAAALAGLDDDTLIQDLVDGRVDSFGAGFAADISGGLSDLAIAARSAMWAGAVWTAYQMGRADTIAGGTGGTGDGSGDGSDQSEINWVCEDDANSCEDCVALGEGSPYTLDTLPTYPGDEVQCGGNCRCNLEGAGGE